MWRQFTEVERIYKSAGDVKKSVIIHRIKGVIASNFKWKTGMLKQQPSDQIEYFRSKLHSRVFSFTYLHKQAIWRKLHQYRATKEWLVISVYCPWEIHILSHQTSMVVFNLQHTMSEHTVSVKLRTNASSLQNWIIKGLTRLPSFVFTLYSTTHRCLGFVFTSRERQEGDKQGKEHKK